MTLIKAPKGLIDTVLQYKKNNSLPYLMNKTLQVLPKYKLGAVFVLGICTFVSKLALILFNGAVLFKFKSVSILKQSVYSVSRI